MKSLDLNIDNQTLVEECKSGDRDAMSILYTRFAPRMLHVITRYVNDRDSAHDILHDGFIAAFTRIDTLRDPEHIEFWLATIMKNLSLKYLQAQTITSILEEIPEIVEEPEIDDILDFDTLETLFRQLPEGYQKVFRLAVLEGKTHKEISEILGIAPNSSSSQLFHAKLRLRELINDYKLRAGLISLMLLIVCSGLLLISRNIDDMPTRDHLSAEARPKKQISKQESPTEPGTEGLTEKETASFANLQPKHTHPAITAAATEDPAHVRNMPSASQAVPERESLIESDSIGDSIASKKHEFIPANPLEDKNTNGFDRMFADLPRKRSKDKGWSAGISFDPGMISFNGISDENFAADPPYMDPEGPSHGTDDDKVNSQARILRIPEDVEYSLATAPRRHHLPITFAITAEKHFTPWLGLESGLGYSYLHTDFERYTEPSTCYWHYIDIPLKVNLYAYTSPRIKLYGSLGGNVSIPVYSYAQIAPNPYAHSGTFRSKTVWAIGGSVGAAFRISKSVDIFVQPTLQYHFPQECTIPNIWTDDKPWSISIPLGFRFSW